MCTHSTCWNVSSGVPFLPDNFGITYLIREPVQMLLALAHEKGVSADELVREAVDDILAEAHDFDWREGTYRSLRRLFAKYGRAPSAEEIDQNRAEMFANFTRSDF